MRSNRRQVKALTILAYTALSVGPLYLLAASAVKVQEDLGFGTTELGYAVSGFFAAGALIAPKMGVLIDRIKARHALRIGMLFSVASSAMISVVARNWWMAAIGIGLCGVAHAVIQLTLNRMLADGDPVDNKAIWFGGKQAAIPIASLGAGLGTALFYPDMSWRGMYVLAAVAAALLAWRVPGSDQPAVGSRVRTGRRATPGLRRFAIAAGFAAASGNALSLLIVDSFHSYGFTETSGTIILGLGSGLAALTRVGSGWLVDRRSSTGVKELRGWLVAGSLAFALIAASGRSPGLLIAGAMLAFVTGWGGWQGILFFAATRDAQIPPAIASGVVLSGTMSGSIIGPALIAVVADTYGYGAGWALAAAALLISALTIRSPVKVVSAG